ncbi:MAG: hypothetical protein IJU54_02990 [Alphaproteobacteria bacterium]|nr:hypothetical protein [Alphaproteobacteria bacterium]
MKEICEGYLKARERYDIDYAAKLRDELEEGRQEGLAEGWEKILAKGL